MTMQYLHCINKVLSHVITIYPCGHARMIHHDSDHGYGDTAPHQTGAWHGQIFFYIPYGFAHHGEGPHNKYARLSTKPGLLLTTRNASHVR